MALYATIIYSRDVDWSQDEHAATTAEYSAFGAAASAVIRGGAALYPTSTATTVQVAGGKGGDVVTTDGPYAETKDALTGFYLLECTDLIHAVPAPPSSSTNSRFELCVLVLVKKIAGPPFSVLGPAISITCWVTSWRSRTAPP